MDHPTTGLLLRVGMCIALRGGLTKACTTYGLLTRVRFIALNRLIRCLVRHGDATDLVMVVCA